MPLSPVSFFPFIVVAMHAFSFPLLRYVSTFQYSYSVLHDANGWIPPISQIP